MEFKFAPLGGEGGIRTLEPLLTITRFPIVRARPATRLLRTKRYAIILSRAQTTATAISYHKRAVLSRDFCIFLPKNLFLFRPFEENSGEKGKKADRILKKIPNENRIFSGNGALTGTF